MFFLIVLVSIFFLSSILMDTPLLAILSFLLFLITTSFFFFYSNLFLGLIFCLIYISAISINLFAVISLIGYTVIYNFTNKFIISICSFLFVFTFVFFIDSFSCLFMYPFIINQVTDIEISIFLFMYCSPSIFLLSLYFFVLSLLISSHFTTKIIKSYDYTIHKKGSHTTFFMYSRVV